MYVCVFTNMRLKMVKPRNVFKPKTDTKMTNSDMKRKILMDDWGDSLRRDGRSDAPLKVGILLIPPFALLPYASAVEPLRAANDLTGETLF